jgi:hypothetical protein
MLQVEFDGANWWSGGSNPTCHLLPALYKASKNAQPLNAHPEDGTAMFAESDNFQHSTRPIPESPSCTLNSSREKPRTTKLNLISSAALYR